MKLEVLQSRAQEIERAIINTTNQLNALHGHKVEINYWIENFPKACDETKNDTNVDSPEVNAVE